MPVAKAIRTGVQLPSPPVFVRSVAEDEDCSGVAKRSRSRSTFEAADYAWASQSLPTRPQRSGGRRLLRRSAAKPSRSTFDTADYAWASQLGCARFLSNTFKLNDSKIARPRGRPRTFDEGSALEKATQVFRSKGYDGVTIDDLVAGMGVGRSSLYAVFGDKRTIFLRALRTYAERKGALAAKALLSPGSIRDSLAGFLRQAVETATEERSAPGVRRAACERP